MPDIGKDTMEQSRESLIIEKRRLQKKAAALQEDNIELKDEVKELNYYQRHKKGIGGPAQQRRVVYGLLNHATLVTKLDGQQVLIIALAQPVLREVKHIQPLPVGQRDGSMLGLTRHS